jgi:hypothetical protein
MKKYACVGIDHEKAIIVTLFGGIEKVSKIDSNAGSRVRLSGGARSKTPYGPQDVSSEKRIEEKRKHILQDYYREIVQEIKKGDKFLIIGPGEAKGELKKEIEKLKELATKISGVEPADKMTDRQLVAKAKDYFNIG